MSQSVRQARLPRLNQDAGLPFFFPVANLFHSPSVRGAFFCPVVRR
ncbi:pyrBI operon leader peptide [Vagococcus sp. WN89Y]